MSADIVIQTRNLGKMYKLFSSRKEKIMDVLGMNHLFFWRKPDYREFWALRGVNLTVCRGERVGIIGHNGAGKSTLLKTLIGSHEVSEGTMSVRGNIQALMQLGTGFHPDFTGRENIRAALGYNNLSPKEISEAEKEIVDFTELEDFIDQPVKNYSAGMYARLAFATATAIKPEILIIDEVLGAGDAYFAGKCVERMHRLSVESGATVLFVSHDLASVQSMCDRCIWIDRGQVRMDGPSLEVIKAYSAQVRQREEIRLRLRNEKKIFSGQSVDVDYSRQLVFRLRAEAGQRLDFPVRGIAFRYRNLALESLSPGAPLDTDAAQNLFLFVNESSRGWSDPRPDGSSFVRNAELSDGKYALGAVVVKDDWDPADLSVAIRCGDTGSGKFFFEYFDGGEYRTAAEIELGDTGNEIGREFALTPSPAKKTAELPPADNPAPPAEAPEEAESAPPRVDIGAADQFGSGELQLVDLHFAANEEERYTFWEGEEISLAVLVRNIMPKPLAAYPCLAVFSEQGFLISVFVSEAMNFKQGENLLEIKLSNSPLLRKGHYIASLAFYKEVDLLDNSKPWDAYLFLDRKLEFKILSQLNIAVPRGLIDLRETMNLKES